MSNKASNPSKLVRFIKAPLRFLSRTKDFYLNSMTYCAGKVDAYGEVMGGPVGPGTTLPKSFSVNSSRSNDDDDLRDLIRAASNRGLREQNEMELKQQQQQLQPVDAQGMPPRSHSVAIGRIDEDKPYDIQEDFKVKTDLVYPRSRSYAVTKRTVMVSS